MEKPHKVYHKPSAGSKLAKKDAVAGVDRTGGKNYNPKVRYPVPPADIDGFKLTLPIRPSPHHPSAQQIVQREEQPKKIKNVFMYPSSTVTQKNAKLPLKRVRA